VVAFGMEMVTRLPHRRSCSQLSVVQCAVPVATCMAACKTA
jgi:hypothetical protein